MTCLVGCPRRPGGRATARAKEGLLAAATSFPTQPAPTRIGGSGTVLLLMASVTVLNVMDRQLLAVLIDPIKAELGVSDAAMGLLTGTSFALLHVVASVPIAVWADRGVRRSIIALGLALWSGLTVLTGFARSFGEIFWIRVGVGVGEATGGAPAQSYLSDAFPPERRATAISVLVMGGPLGSMVAFGLGGWLGDAVGWRTAFILFGAPGLVLAIAIRLILLEPVRRADVEVAARPRALERSDPPDQVGSEMPAIPLLEAVGFLFRVRAIRNFVLAAGLNTVGIYAILVWAVPYLHRVHGLTASQAGPRLAIASGLFAALGTLAGGPLADRLARRDERWLGWLPAITSALVLPFGIAFALAPDGDLASVLLAPASFMAGTYFGPVLSAVQSLAPPPMRALAASAITAVNTILGLGLAPPLVGFLNDVLAASYGNESIRYSLAGLMIVHLAASGLMWRASTTLREDLIGARRFGEGTS